MKLIVYPNIEFEIDKEASIKECIAFLLSKGFEDIENFHFDIGYIICTANFFGRHKPNFKMCLQDLSQYGEWIAARGLDNQHSIEYNANKLNLLCQRDGRER